MEKTATLDQIVASPKSGLLIGRVEIQGPEHRIPIPTKQGPEDKTPVKATQLGWKSGYVLFYDSIPKGFNKDTRKYEDIRGLKSIDATAVSVQFPDYDIYNGHSSRFITYGPPTFYDT